jgi:hypothetical protein
MKDSDSKIVADGMRRLREVKDYPAVRKRMLADVACRYKEEKKRASFWRRLWLEVKVRREVRVALQKEFPPSALYIATTTK